MIFFNQGMLLLGSNHFLIDIMFVVGVSERTFFHEDHDTSDKVEHFFVFSFFVQFFNCILNVELGKRCLLRAMPCWNVT